jgi:hypothetical protein
MTGNSYWSLSQEFFAIFFLVYLYFRVFRVFRGLNSGRKAETLRLVRLKVRTNSGVEVPIGQSTGCP